jgi:hypothetical protein
LESVPTVTAGSNGRGAAVALVATWAEDTAGTQAAMPASETAPSNSAIGDLIPVVIYFVVNGLRPITQAASMSSAFEIASRNRAP